MKQHNWGSVLLSFAKENLYALVMFCAVVTILLYGLATTQEGSAQEGLRIVEESVTRAIVSCYAIEGMYPESLDYMTEHYGLVIDESKYFVQYTAHASNLMPVVTVIEVGS